LERSFFSKYNQNDNVKEDEMGGACSTNGVKKNVYRLLVGKPTGKRPLGRPRCRWVDNIKMDLGEMRWGGVDWIGLTKDRDKWRAIVNVVIHKMVESSLMSAQAVAPRVVLSSIHLVS
jgi:hypothetical protein